jgi:hypothetical protein
MRVLSIIFVLFLSACSTTDNNNQLKEAMAYGTLIELNKFDEHIQKEMLIRLYEVPNNSSNCFVESHGVCKYEYFLSVSTFDEYPEVGVFKLSVSGKILNTEWVVVEQPDYAEIVVTYSEYTNEAYENNKTLKKKVLKTELKISLDGIVENTI